MDIWIEVASDLNKEVAKEMFEKWVRENPAHAQLLSSEDIRIDTIYTNEKKCLTRYQVRQLKQQNK